MQKSTITSAPCFSASEAAIAAVWALVIVNSGLSFRTSSQISL